MASKFSEMVINLRQLQRTANDPAMLAVPIWTTKLESYKGTWKGDHKGSPGAAGGMRLENINGVKRGDSVESTPSGCKVKLSASGWASPSNKLRASGEKPVC